MNVMVGFVRMARKQLYGKNVEIRADWRNVANELGNLWEVGCAGYCMDGCWSGRSCNRSAQKLIKGITIIP